MMSWTSHKISLRLVMAAPLALARPLEHVCPPEPAAQRWRPTTHTTNPTPRALTSKVSTGAPRRPSTSPWPPCPRPAPWVPLPRPMELPSCQSWPTRPTARWCSIPTCSRNPTVQAAEAWAKPLARQRVAPAPSLMEPHSTGTTELISTQGLTCHYCCGLLTLPELTQAALFSLSKCGRSSFSLT